jgi:GcrA cell cycle regulator
MFDWNEERVALLKERLDEKVSASLIAGELGCSRNAVIGKAHRAGFEFKVKPRANLGEDRKKKPRRVGGVVAHTRQERLTLSLLEATPMPFEPLNIPTIALKDHHCRAAVNPDGEPYVFCGHDVEPGLPYCPLHCRAFYEPAAAKPRKYFSLPGRAA